MGFPFAIMVHRPLLEYTATAAKNALTKRMLVQHKTRCAQQ